MPQNYVDAHNTLGHGQSPKALFSMFVYIFAGDLTQDVNKCDTLVPCKVVYKHKEQCKKWRGTLAVPQCVYFYVCEICLRIIIAHEL